MVPENVVVAIENTGVKCGAWSADRLFCSCDGIRPATNKNCFIRACELRPGEWVVSIFDEVQCVVVDGKELGLEKPA